MNLYTMTAEFKLLLESFNNNPDEFDIDAFNEELTQKTDDINKKRLAKAYVIKTLEARIEMLEKVKKDLELRISPIVNKIDNLYSDLKNSLEETKTTFVQGLEFDIKINGCKKSVFLNNKDIIPGYYISKKITTETLINKNEIFKDLSAGKEVPGAELQGGTTLKIG